MASIPDDPRWPPSDGVTFDAVMNRLLRLKAHHFPQHTSRDRADPFIQMLRLVAALGQHVLGRNNLAFKMLDPKHATSRRAMISLMEVLNRPLRPIQPAQGYVYGKLAAAPVAGDTMIPEGTTFAQPGIQDPVFSVDEDVDCTSIDFSMWHYDSSAGSAAVVAVGTPITVDSGDSVIIGFESLQFDAVDVALSVAHSQAQVYSVEYYNVEWGEPDSVSETLTEIELSLDEYLHTDPVGIDKMVGLSVVVKLRSTGTYETGTVFNDGGIAKVSVSKLGQSDVSTSSADYEVLAQWRPVSGSTDGTSGLTANGTVLVPITSLRSETDWIEDHPDYGFAIRMRHVSGAGLPEQITVSSLSNSSGDFYATAKITQGYRLSVNVGQTEDRPFQHMPLSSDPLEEPVFIPTITLEVAGSSEWSVVDDFSNSGPFSKHAILREDPDDGWGIVFGDGNLGELPDVGSSVKATYRTGSFASGDLDPGVSIRALTLPGTVKSWVMPRGTSGFEIAEASDRASVLRFRYGVIPQLALRSESVVTPGEIQTAMSGGAPGRATFETYDGRRPFSRSVFSLSGVGDRQYRVVVVGSESDLRGDVSADDIDEATAWLNGTRVGVEIVGGHGQQNTQALVGAFSPRFLTPTITITINDTDGVRAQAYQVVLGLIKPHARDTDGNFRWSFGASLPITSILFGLLWDALPGRTNLSVAINDGLSNYTMDQSISMDEFELPVLSESFDQNSNIILVAG